MQPKYTFLLPAYKARFFAEALESIKQQTYTDFLCVVSDDCSPEDLRSIYVAVVGDDPRFSFRRNAENMGGKSLVSHWNLLVDLCQTDYLIMASDDDVYEPNYLEEIDALTEKYPEVDLYRGRVKRIDGDGDVIEKDYILEEKQSQIDFLFDFYQRDMVKCIANYVFRKDSLVRKGYFYEMPLAWGSDDITVLNMSENGICNTPSLVFSFRMSSENISGADTARTVRIKTGAMYSYIHYLNRYLDEMKGRLSSKLEQRQWRMVKGKINTDSYYSDSVYNGAAFSPYKEMMSYYHYLLEIGYITGKLEALHFFWTWLRAYKVR